MPIVSPHSEFYEVRGFDCGYGGPLLVLPMMNFLQETAGEHASRLGLGMESLQADGKTWMLSRIDLRVDSSPIPGERIEVETWPAGCERLFALRDFVLRRPGGEAFVRAVYAYLVVDLAARRPLRPERFFAGEEPITEKPHPVSPHSFDVGEPASPALAFSLRAGVRHLDDNGHVNNAHIVDWLADAVPRGLRGAGRLAALKVAFLAEILEGDLLEAVCGPASRAAIGADAGVQTLVTELRRDGTPVARAETMWQG
jgi:medium-chain acyl-[acyl-carrier-protein] hydrolase